MEAQLQRKHIRANNSLGVATLLATTLIAGAGAGYVIGTTFSASQVATVPAIVEQLSTSRSAHDDWAFDTVPASSEQVAPASRSVRDDWAFETAEVQSTATLRQGVQTRHQEQAEEGSDGIMSETVDIAPLLLGRPY